MIDLARLRALRAVATYGTVTAAARALHCTPSAVSQHLTKLDRETGTTLLEKDGRRLRLTEAGRVLVGHAGRGLAAGAGGPGRARRAPHHGHGPAHHRLLSDRVSRPAPACVTPPRRRTSVAGAGIAGVRSPGEPRSGRPRRDRPGARGRLAGDGDRVPTGRFRADARVGCRGSRCAGWASGRGARPAGAAGGGGRRDVDRVGTGIDLSRVADAGTAGDPATLPGGRVRVAGDSRRRGARRGADSPAGAGASTGRRRGGAGGSAAGPAGPSRPSRRRPRAPRAQPDALAAAPRLGPPPRLRSSSRRREGGKWPLWIPLRWYGDPAPRAPDGAGPPGYPRCSASS